MALYGVCFSLAGSLPCDSLFFTLLSTLGSHPSIGGHGHFRSQIASLPFLKECFMLFLIETDRQSVSGGGVERGGIHRIQSRLLAVSTEPDAGLELMNQEIMT